MFCEEKKNVLFTSPIILLLYNDECWCEVAKHVVSHGACPTVKKYGVSESTVHGFVKSLKWQQTDNPNAEFIALPQKKRVDRNSYLTKSMKKLSIWSKVLGIGCSNQL